VTKNGKEAVINEFNNPNGIILDPDLFIFAFDNNGTLFANL
jgi:hypothetical protein